MAAADNLPAKGKSLDAVVIDIVIRLVFLGLFVYWSFSLIAPFVVIVVWAVVLTVALYPTFLWLRNKLFGRSSLSALVITLLGLAVLMGPAIYLATSMAESLQGLAEGLKEGRFSVPAPWESVREWPFVGEQIYRLWSLAASNLTAFVTQHKEVFLSVGQSLLGSTASVAFSVLSFAASMILTAFLFAPGPALAAGARRFATRLVAERGAGFIDLAGATIRNVSRGVVGVALLQSILAGVGLIVAGVPAAGLLTFGVLLLCIVQVGPGIILLPVTIWIWTDLESWMALLFTVYMVPVALMDNILKPIVMGKGLTTPMLVIFIGVIGGTLAHGLIGLFLGPIILSVFYELLKAWIQEVDVGKEDNAPEEAQGEAPSAPAGGGL